VTVDVLRGAPALGADGAFRDPLAVLVGECFDQPVMSYRRILVTA
jgi:hypothetical protein